MFGGITGIGIEEVSGEEPTVDATLTLGAGAQPVMTVRPEFDVTLAFNPASSLIPVARIEGIGFTLLHAGTGRGGSIIGGQRSEEHTSELQSLMRISYAVFCLKKKKRKI